MMKIKVINGPNLNMLGKREPEKYGSESLEDIRNWTDNKLAGKVHFDWWQSNSEEKIIDEIHSLVDSDFEALIINPAAYSHTSVAILDALKILNMPIAEVHLTNVYSRESFRHTMLTAQASSIIMGGIGHKVYYYAALALIDK